ncbi:UDP-glucuronate 4-epimerase 6 [Linum perenne]
MDSSEVTALSPSGSAATASTTSTISTLSSLQRSRQELLLKHGVFIVEGDLNADPLLIVEGDPNPQSYISSNIAGFINLLEVAKTSNPQPAIVWVSSSSVYGHKSK